MCIHLNQKSLSLLKHYYKFSANYELILTLFQLPAELTHSEYAAVMDAAGPLANDIAN